MSKSRLEAFSDGVLAIIITIMVLEMKSPHEAHISALKPLIPVFLSYVMSFLYLGIYWNNHHHLLQAVSSIKGSTLWANLHLLFWLSLIPFVTRWMGENSFAPIPVAFYGLVLFFAGLAYFILEKSLVKFHGKDSVLAAALGQDCKTKASLACYLLGIGLALFQPWISFGLYSFVAVLWLIPDRRIEKKLIEMK